MLLAAGVKPPGRWPQCQGLWTINKRPAGRGSRVRLHPGRAHSREEESRAVGPDLRPHPPLSTQAALPFSQGEGKMGEEPAGVAVTGPGQRSADSTQVSGLGLWTPGGHGHCIFLGLGDPGFAVGEDLDLRPSRARGAFLINPTPLALSSSLAGVFHTPRCLPRASGGGPPSRGAAAPSPGPGRSAPALLSVVWAPPHTRLSAASPDTPPGPVGLAGCRGRGGRARPASPHTHPLRSLWLCLAGAGQAGLLQ